MSSQKGEQEEKQLTEGLDQSLTLHIKISITSIIFKQEAVRVKAY